LQLNTFHQTYNEINTLIIENKESLMKADWMSTFGDLLQWERGMFQLVLQVEIKKGNANGISPLPHDGIVRPMSLS